MDGDSPLGKGFLTGQIKSIADIPGELLRILRHSVMIPNWEADIS